MTKQFNALAAEGWEYVGAVTPAGTQAPGSGARGIPPPGGEASGVLTLFKRATK